MENENDHVAHDDAGQPDDIDDEDDDDDDIRAEGLVCSEDDEANENDDDDPVAEGEEQEMRRLEPSFKYHGELKFSLLCKCLEWICRRKNDKTRSTSKQTLLEKLIPPILFEEEKARRNAGEPPESIFPMMRLLYPDKDGSRNINLKEAKLADAYIGAYDWNNKFKEYQMLKNPNDPKIVGQEPGIAGNFSMVVQKILTGIDGQKRMDKTESKLTLNDINQALDELAAIDKQGRGDGSSNNNNTHRGGKPKSKKSQTAEWMKQFLFGPKRIPPLEHKWLVRIIMGKLEFGIGFDQAMKHYHFLATQIFSAHSSLRVTCERVCYIPRTRHVSSDDEAVDTKGGVNSAGTLSYLQGPSADIQLGKIFAPMLSQKTGFEKILNDISKRHRAFARVATEAAKERNESSHPATKSLACQHPAFTIETKLDGERMIMHYERDGSLVKFHTRRGNWYSTGYSPVLGPAIRKAFGWSDLDLVLDGEVISWDNGRQETVPFGFNRTIARKRYEYMDRNGLLDHRDRDLHKDEQDSKVFGVLSNWDGKSSEESDDLTGRECWLQYIVFDVVYVGGPGAADFLSKTVSSYLKDLKPGCIMGLDAFERKKILYRLCRTQVDEVDIVPTIVVRPNGGVALGSEYFSDTSPIQEYGHPAHKIDSIASLLVEHVPNIAHIDEKQRERLSDEEISQARANAIDRHYKEIVELRRLEGLVFKDLNTPYVLDLESRGLRYWWKFKPDYFCGSIASDIDVVVVGAYFATGLRHSGKPSSFLVACLDGKLYNDYGETKFCSLCKVNGGSTKYKDLNRLLEETGFKVATREQPCEEGKWFRLDDRGTPDFLSSGVGQESSQSQMSQSQSSQGQNWRFKKKDYPDLWIDPEDSKILTLNAGEIVYSDAFSAGLTLRFPTIVKVRFDGDDKPLHEIESDLSLWAKYNSVVEDRSQSAPEASFRSGSSSRHQGPTKCRFLTERQQQLAQKSKRMRRRKRQGVEIAPAPEEPTSSILKGVTFTVLDGVYRLDPAGIDAKEAREQGWLDAAKAVRDKYAVASFVKDHGGTVIVSTKIDSQCYELGGRMDDELVKQHIKRVEQVLNKKPTGKKLTKREEEDQRVAKFEGVLHWTFVFSLVHRWIATGKSRDTPIKEVDPDFLVPAATDYLARPFAEGENRLSDLAATELTSTNIERVLEMVAQRSDDIVQTKKRGPPPPSWQYEATKQLKSEELWAMDLGNQPLWPYKREQSSEEASKVVLYPDVFGSNFGNEVSSLPTGVDFAINDGERWKIVAGIEESLLGVITPVIPLARVCGAYVTSHLHVGVTHVLCDLKEESNRIIEYEPGLTESVFRDPSDGKRILYRLRYLESRRIEHHQIYLVSPDWLRKDVWGSEGLSANDS